MKHILFAAAVAISLPAFAQDMAQPTPPPADMSAPPAAPNNGAMQPAPGMPDSNAPADATMPATQPGATTTGSDTMTTQSDPGSTAAPTNGSMGAMQGATAEKPATPSTTNYPTCSKTVTDSCISRSAATKSKKRRG